MLNGHVRSGDPPADQGIAADIDAVEGTSAVFIIDEALGPGRVGNL